MSTKSLLGDLNIRGLASDGPPDQDICSCTSAPNGHVYRHGHTLCHDEFRGLRSGSADQVALETTTGLTTPIDEAHFWLNGYVNKQNCRIWSEANPQVYVETPLHPEKLTVWCALWAGGILLQKR
ncbi:hypothetical protein TNCV_2296331 [Trichonephila clavipes]|nr:hypothetical protein TNCV_2296331 [Trichonephila clavipes]